MEDDISPRDSSDVGLFFAPSLASKTVIRVPRRAASTVTNIYRDSLIWRPGVPVYHKVTIAQDEAYLGTNSAHFSR